jgi:hypothetical protein
VCTAESFIVRIMLEARLGSSHANMEYHYELNNALYGLVMFRLVWKHALLQRQMHFAEFIIFIRVTYSLKHCQQKIKFVKPTFLEWFTDMTCTVLSFHVLSDTEGFIASNQLGQLWISLYWACTDNLIEVRA